jgi:hypothetical protein
LNFGTMHLHLRDESLEVFIIEMYVLSCYRIRKKKYKVVGDYLHLAYASFFVAVFRLDRSCRKRWVMILDPNRASNTVEEEHNDGNDEAFDSVPV